MAVIAAQRTVEKLLFEAEPLMHPHVQDAYAQAVKVLSESGIKFRVTGGVALNLRGAGRPTKDVDFIVPKKDWHRARKVLQTIATDSNGVFFGLPGEPENGMAVIGPHGVAIEIWPAGTAHGLIALTRGKHREHPAGKIALEMEEDELVSLVNSKLASYLSATDRLRDAADVQSLISVLALPLEFGSRLAPVVRTAFARVWKGEI
jgi:hypothetical protein